VAFTLLGYLVAEMGGRKDESASNSLRRVFGYVLAFSILSTTLRNLFSEPAFYLVEAVLFAAAAMYGAIIYRLQLAAVRAFPPPAVYHADDPSDAGHGDHGRHPA